MWGRGPAAVTTSEHVQHPGACAVLAVAHGSREGEPKGSLSVITGTRFLKPLTALGFGSTVDVTRV